MNTLSELPGHILSNYGLLSSATANQGSGSARIESMARQTRRWRVARCALRLVNFTLFGIAVAALLVGLDTTLDLAAQTDKIIQLGTFAIGGALITAGISSVVDKGVRVQAAARSVHVLPLLTREALLDFWDTVEWRRTADVATHGVKGIITEHIHSGDMQALYPYARDLLRLLTRTRNPTLIRLLIRWVEVARPIGSLSAVHWLERRLWIRENDSVYTDVRNCLTILNGSGGSIAASLVLLRGSEQPANQVLLRAAAATTQVEPDMLLRPSAETD